MNIPAYWRSRRVAGLRREEVAQLVGVSVDYYARLEQGRASSVSDTVLNSLSQVFGLDENEHAYLLAVARPNDVTTSRMPETIRPELQLLLDSLMQTPAAITGPHMEVLAWNRLYRAVFGLDGRDLNGWSVPKFIFLDETSRTFFPDWSAVALQCVAHLRSLKGRRPRDEKLANLVRFLIEESRDFSRMWGQYRVSACTHGSKMIRHELVGLLELAYESFPLPDAPDASLLVYTASKSSKAVDNMSTLDSLLHPDDADGVVPGLETRVHQGSWSKGTG